MVGSNGLPLYVGADFCITEAQHSVSESMGIEMGEMDSVTVPTVVGSMRGRSLQNGYSPKCDTDDSIIAAQVISGAAEAIKGTRDPFSDPHGSALMEKNPAMGDIGLGRPSTSSGRKGAHERKGVV